MADTKNSSGLLDDEMKEIVESFLIETREIIEGLDQDLLELERGSTNPDLLNRIFRAAHTVKGTSGFLGFDQMCELTHKFEEVLNKLRKNEVQITPELINGSFQAFDTMKVLLQKIQTNDATPIDLNDILTKLDTLSGHHVPEPEPDLPDPHEVVLDQTLPADIPAAPLKTAPDDDAAQGTASKVERTTDTTIRVDVQRLDNLMNLVGELVLGRNRLAQISFLIGNEHENEELTKELLETSSQIDFITTELQSAIMKTRMVPIGRVFNKFPRLVRDLALDARKDIDLVITGEETELDKSIIEEINDPLIHILRNSVDHGIESIEERRMHGKTIRGSIWLQAEHEGNHIVITIEDDGRGMDPVLLKAKAVEKGLLTEAEAAELSLRDTYNLIFLPGFSTARQVTNMSGRGVGMDIVRTNITRLNGLIDVESTVGMGTKIVIKLPLTLAIIQSLLIQVRQEIFVIPLSTVIEVVRITPDDIDTINGKEVIRIRDSVLPLVRIDAIFDVPGETQKSNRVYVVVIGLAESRIGIVADSLLGQKEVVIKSLGGYLGNVDGIAGSTILGDGTVKMIIDIGELIKLVGSSRKDSQ
jgi:two-component system, chemotaxis family, sensor kinase CheA